MKKILFLLSIIFAGLTAASGQSSMVLVESSGKVEFNRGDTWRAASVGDELPMSATIATGFGSRAVLESNGSRIIVEPLSRLTLEELSSDSSGNSNTSLNLRTGRIRASVRRSNTGTASFRVGSPVATAAVRGTEFGFNGFGVQVGDGTVNFRSGRSGRNVNVPQGGGSGLDDNGNPIPVDEGQEDKVKVDSNPAPPEVGDLLTSGEIGGSGLKSLVIRVQ